MLLCHFIVDIYRDLIYSNIQKLRRLTPFYLKRKQTIAEPCFVQTIIKRKKNVVFQKDNDFSSRFNIIRCCSDRRGTGYVYIYIYIVYWWDIKKLIICIFIFIILYFVVHISSAKTNESVINIICKLWLPFYGYGFFISKGVKAKFLQK